MFCRIWSINIDVWMCHVVFRFLTNRKNWTSSWTVLQGSSLLFAKGQGGSTSWVGIPSATGALLFQLPFRHTLSSLLPSSFPHPSSALFIVLRCLSSTVFISFLSHISSSKSYYRSGSIPELLLTLLSSWKRSVKPRPAVSYVNCRPVQAAVCPFSLHVLLLLPVFHYFFTDRHWWFCVCRHWVFSTGNRGLKMTNHYY